jgi:succinate-semialdehyde dehydrogenase/glutarate-semialdehyde dehydrogenase
MRPGFDVALAEALLHVAVARPGAERHATLAPFDGMPLIEVPYSVPADVDQAFDTARLAQPKWAAVSAGDRRRIMLRFHDMLLEHRAEGLDLIQWETGKTRMDALKELLAVCTVARHYARDAARLLTPDRVRGLFPGLTRVRIEHHPVGVVGVISPWNYPLFLAVGDAIPALMAGNAVVLKPDHQTSLTALWVVDLMQRAGIPPRVLQVVLGYGPELGPELTERADYVMFTGSTAVGSTIAARCGERLVGCSMELGGKNAMIVTADADPGRAAEVAIRGCFDNAGQLCVGMERIYTVGAVHEPFVTRLLSRIKSLRMRAAVGWGTDYGSLISLAQLERVQGVVADAVEKGAEVLTGGMPLPDIGPYFYAPTVLTGVTPDMRAYDRETFGPVVALHQVGSDEEAITLANDTDYGLNASISVRDNEHGQDIGRRLKAGTVNVNEAYEAAFGSVGAPMGGMRHSGLGRRNGDQGLLRFTEPQTIAVQNIIGIGTPFGMEHEEWGEMIVRGFKLMRAFRLK